MTKNKNKRKGNKILQQEDLSIEKQQEQDENCHLKSRKWQIDLDKDFDQDDYRKFRDLLLNPTNDSSYNESQCNSNIRISQYQHSHIEQQDKNQSQPSQKKNNNKIKGFRNIFKKSPNKLKKNNNVSKFLCRIHINNCSKYLYKFNLPLTIKSNITLFINRQKKEYKQKDASGKIIINKNRNNNLKAMKKIFGKKSNDDGMSSVMRKIAHQLIRDQMMNCVILNSQIKEKKMQYMVKLKVQALRCINHQLMCRMESL